MAEEIFDLLIEFCGNIHITIVDLEQKGNVVFSYTHDYFMKVKDLQSPEDVVHPQFSGETKYHTKMRYI